MREIARVQDKIRRDRQRVDARNRLLERADHPHDDYSRKINNFFGNKI
jgi:hypothetical protein